MPRHSLARGGNSSRASFSSSTRRLDTARGASTRNIQESLEGVPFEEEMPRNAREMAMRERQRDEDYGNIRVWRTQRLKTITNQWADNRVKNSGLEQARRASWVRTDNTNDVNGNRWNSLFCCCG